MGVTPTSELIAQQEQTDAELRRRFAQIFAAHRANAFLHRHDHLFLEQWTPQSAAASYEFERYEIGSDEITLYGTSAPIASPIASASRFRGGWWTIRRALTSTSVAN